MTKRKYCGATTRAGTPCRRPAGWGTDHPGEGRCKLHGGKSPRGLLHPRFKHGKYAKYEVVVISRRMRGKRTVVNEVVVEFDRRGRCLGIVISDQRKGIEHDPPLPLRPQDVKVFQELPSYTVKVRKRRKKWTRKKSARAEPTRIRFMEQFEGDVGAGEEQGGEE